MKQVIYIDILIGVNLIINYFLLLATAKFLYIKFKKFRLFLAEILSGIYSLYILLPNTSLFTSLLIKLFMSVTIILVVFGLKSLKEFLKSIICFYFINFLFSGVMFALWYLYKPNGMAINNGVVYFNISPIMLIVTTLVSYIIIELINRVLEKRENKNLICDVLIKVGEKTIKLKAKVDTGNSLKEPFSNLPVMVVSKSYLEEVLPSNFENLFDYTQKFKENLEFKIRFIPIQTVSGEGMLPAFKPDSIKIKNQSEKQAYVAVCSENILPLEVPALLNPLLID